MNDTPGKTVVYKGKPLKTVLKIRTALQYENWKKEEFGYVNAFRQLLLKDQLNIPEP